MIWKRLIQAPMAGAQGFELAAAVHRSGGVGSIPCAMLSMDQIQQEFDSFTKATKQMEQRVSKRNVQVNLNFFAHKEQARSLEKERVWEEKLAPYFAELGISSSTAFRQHTSIERKTFNQDHLGLVRQLRPSIVSFHFGLPEDLQMVAELQAMGISVWSTATTVEEADWLSQVGHVDAIIVQGSEAGGHRGTFQDLQHEQGMELPMLLTKILADGARGGGKRKAKVIAAGCCAEGERGRIALSLGADAIQVGSCFLLCGESRISLAQRQVLRQSTLHGTAITNVFTGKPARGVVNRLVRELGPISDYTPGFPHTSRLTSALRTEAESVGVLDFTPVWRGEHWTAIVEQEDSAEQITKVLLKKITNTIS